MTIINLIHNKTMISEYPEGSIPSIFKVPISMASREIAQQFSQQHRGNKAKQVLLNTLAVSAVDFYLHSLEIRTSWAASCSHDLVYRLLMDVADLELPGLGKLECRPVLPDADFVYIPPEVWWERIAYIAVQLDSSFREATLLGFTTTTATVTESGELPLTQLQPFTQFSAYIRQIQQIELDRMRVNLSQWFDKQFDAGWQPLESLTTNHQIALRHRQIFPLHENSVRAVKPIDLGVQIGNKLLAMLVMLVPESDGQVSVVVQLHPTDAEKYLPPNIRLALLLESGEMPESVHSHGQDNYIQLRKFQGRPGERFNIQVSCGETGVTENFTL